MISKVLKRLRNINDLTQQEMADRLGISRSTLAGYETENKQPSYEMLKHIANEFNITTDELLGVKTISPPNTTPTFKNRFSQIVLELLRENNMNIDEFCKKVGIIKETLDFYLFSDVQPIADDLLKISATLNVSIDFLLDNSKRKRITADEEMLLSSFNRCSEECKKYLIAKAGVLSIEGISAVAAAEYGQYLDNGKKSYPSNGTEGLK